MSGQFHAPAALPPGKGTLLPLDRKLSWPGRGGEKVLAPAGTGTVDLIKILFPNYMDIASLLNCIHLGNTNKSMNN
jgi:hypothetical protein